MIRTPKGRSCISIIAFVLMIVTSWLPINVYASATQEIPLENRTDRVYGNDRYDTMYEVALKMNSGVVSNVVLANGINYADALAGVPFAHQKGSPILLVDRSPETSSQAFAYVKDHVDKTGNIYILGGPGAIPDTFIAKLIEMGFAEKNIHRIGGLDRYETSVEIAKNMVHDGTEFYLASGDDFSDALSASVVAATTNYVSVEEAAYYKTIGQTVEASLGGVPLILIPSSDNIPDQIITYMNTLQVPNGQSIKIIGGPSVIPDSHLTRLKESLLQLRAEGILRIAGIDRYETMEKVNAQAEHLNSSWENKGLSIPIPRTFVASGENFPDALAGAVLAVKAKAPLVLVDNNLPEGSRNALQNIHDKNLKRISKGTVLTILGGTGVISNLTVALIEQILNVPVNYTPPISSGGGGGSSVDSGSGDDGGTPPPVPQPLIPAASNSLVNCTDNGDLTAKMSLTVKTSEGVAVTDLNATDFTVVRNEQSYVIGNSPIFRDFKNTGNGNYEVTYAPGFAVKGAVKLIVKEVVLVEALSVVILPIGDPEVPIISSYVAGGAEHSLSLQVDGTVLAWGGNLYGQLGNGETSGAIKTLPTQVTGLSNVVAVAAGEYHSLALKRDGSVWGWGRNEYGVLSSGSYNQTTPYQLVGLNDIIAIAAGNFLTMALKSDGTVWTLGANLGDVDKNTSGTPIKVPEMKDVIAIASGNDHALAVKRDGTVWTWGENDHGQLGNDELGLTGESKTPVQVNGLTDVKAVAGGYIHSLALKNDGTVWAWGANNTGQLGKWPLEAYGDNENPSRVEGLENITAIAAGWEWSLAMQNGRIQAWGDDNWGQLGDGSETTTSDHIVQVVNLTNMKGISAGKEHSLAIGEDNTVWAWGRNTKDQLGVEDIDESKVPVQVGAINEEPPTIRSAAMPSMAYDSVNHQYLVVYESKENNGYSHIYGKFIKPDGSVQGAEFRISNLEGADLNPTVAYNSITQKFLVAWSCRNSKDNVVAQIVNAETGQVEGGVITLTREESDSIFDLAVTANDTEFLVVWGQNNDIRGRFVSNAGVLGRDMSSLTGMSNNFPAITFANGKFLIAYQGTNGNDYDVKVNFVNAEGSLSGEAKIIATGNFQQKNPKVTYSGNNQFLVTYEDEQETGQYDLKGQIIDASSNLVGGVIEFSNEPNDQINPSVAYSPRSDCVLVTWQDGRNGNKDIYGQKLVFDGMTWILEGNNFAINEDAGDQANPILVYQSNTENFFIGYESAVNPTVILTHVVNVPVVEPAYAIALAAGKAFSLALLDDGSVWSWGYGGYGRLGNGNLDPSSTPVQVEDLANVTQIAAGEEHGMALKEGGIAVAWGNNEFGQLGVNTSPYSFSSTPKTLGLANLEGLGGGYGHSLGVQRDGSAWAWGRNAYGSLGIGTTDLDKHTTPTKAKGEGSTENLTGIVALDGGREHSIALTELGEVYTWGQNNKGQLGNNSTVTTSSPIQVAGLSEVKAIAAGKDHNLALKEDGTVWSWGDNETAQLGDGTIVNRLVPVQVSGLTNVRAVAAGDWFSVALKSDGTVWIWGQNRVAGNLGLEGGSGSLIPAQVKTSAEGGPLMGIQAIAAGNEHILALNGDGAVWMWGIEHLYNNDRLIPYPEKVNGFNIRN